MVRVRGATMLEALVALVLLALGLAGLAGVHARATAAHFEAYQRTQALALAHDMAERMQLNKPDASAYVDDGYGEGPLVDCAGLSGSGLDRCMWGNALRGAAERLGAQPVGTLAAGRGCVTGPDDGVYRVVVTWQALAAGVAPLVHCGRGDAPDLRLLRSVAVPVRLADLVRSAP